MVVRSPADLTTVNTIAHMPKKQLLTTRQLAEYLQRPEQWVRQNAEDLGGVKVGSLWRFDLDDVKVAIRAKRNPDLSEKRPDGVDPWSPTPRSAKAQAAMRRKRGSQA